MEIFYSPETEDGRCILTDDEAAHCVKVLRHKAGDIISVINGKGTMYSCRILSASPKCVEAEILSAEENWGAHPYRLHLAVAPTKNADRYEWFAEKACEIGVDEITPVIGRHSERKIFKTARIEKILISAAKQSLKGSVPSVNAPVPVSDFILKYGMPEPAGNNMQDGPNPPDGHIRLIASDCDDRAGRRLLPRGSGTCRQTRIHPRTSRALPSPDRDSRRHCRRSSIFQMDGLMTRPVRQNKPAGSPADGQTGTPVIS